MKKGIDIYSGTEITDWNAIKASGVEVVYIKLTDGLTYINPKALEQYNAAKSVGLKVGAYHFGEKNSAQDEYNHFMREASKYQWDVKFMFDYEVTSPDFNFITQFMGLNPNFIIYGSHSVVDKCGLPLNRIWVAEPTDIANTNYKEPTSTRGYAGIQHKWYGKINGLQGNADVDLFDDSIILNIAVTLPILAQQTVQQSGSPATRIIQLELNTLLKKDLAVDGITGPSTIEAIKEFQKAMGLTVDGIWGPATAGAVGQIYARPVDGVPYAHAEYATRYIQYRVGGSIDGVFGSNTKIYVQNWQAKHGLVADGIVGTGTWSKLLDENC